MTEHDEILFIIRGLKDDMDNIKSDVELLKKKLIIGNGEPSLLTRHALLEQRVDASASNKKLYVGLVLTFVLQTLSAIVLYFVSQGHIKL